MEAGDSPVVPRQLSPAPSQLKPRAQSGWGDILTSEVGDRQDPTWPVHLPCTPGLHLEATCLCGEAPGSCWQPQGHCLSTHPSTHIFTHPHTHLHTHQHPSTHPSTHTYTRIHTHIHPRTHIHTHTSPPVGLLTAPALSSNILVELPMPTHPSATALTSNH